MNILHISIAYPKSGASNIYSDLDTALVENGHNVCVAVSDNTAGELSASMENGIEVMRIASRKIFSVGPVQKALAFIELPYLMKRAIGEKFGSRKFDLIIFEAPPVTLWKAVKWAKKKFSCPAYLMQKDIFPQNAVDLKMFSKHSLPYFYFRRQEIKMLQTADAIGCMSDGNIRYILEHNTYLNKDKVCLFPNTEKLSPMISDEQKRSARQAISKKFGIPPEACVFIFGGNMGRPQDIPFLCGALKCLNGNKRAYFLCIGTGNEAGRLKSFIESNNITNAKYFAKMPRDDYIEAARGCDVGLVVLNSNFTIPNYPSKTLGYMQSSLPILAATDTNTDYKDLIESAAECGLWCNSSDTGAFVQAVERFSGDENLRRKLGRNGRKYFEENFQVSRSVEILEDFMKGRSRA